MLKSHSKQRIHGFSLAESFPGKRRVTLPPVGLCSCQRASELPFLVSRLHLIEASVHQVFYKYGLDLHHNYIYRDSVPNKVTFTSTRD